ncbi:MAG TPA: HAMP domain-containing sensor histidine kinase [Thermoanaerobaculia bacterium]|jgi:signal transduction histidine kinase
MRRLFRLSLLWVTPIVIVLIAVLIAMQYRFLRTLERASASAERNTIRSSAEELGHTIDKYWRTTIGRALTLPTAALASNAAAGEHFRVNQVAAARTFFITRYDGAHADSQWFTPAGLERPMPTGDELNSVKVATVSWHAAHKLDRIVWKPELEVDERDPRHRVVMKPLIDDSKHVIGVVGVVLDESVAKAVMLQVGKNTLHAQNRSGMKSLKIAERFPVMPNGRDYIAQPLGFVFTKWSIGLADTCASPEEIASQNFRINALWTGAVILMLLGSVGLAISAAARQMRLSQMKSDFVSNVSHELRTPLSSIRVFGEYMRLGRVTKPEKILEYGEYIEAEGRRLTQLINNILDFSKIESSEKKYRYCEVDVVELVTQTVAAFEVPMRDQGLSVKLLAPAAPLVLLMDKDAIGQALMNLLDNAVKYSNGNKDVEVSVTSGNGVVRIAVRDHGIGIPYREQKKIFEKFYRVGSGLVHDVKGSGLGLAIVSHVVQAHGGRVEVASTPGEGSMFTIVLPLPGTASVPVRSPEYA